MKTITTHKTVVAAVAVVAALALPMMAGAADKLKVVNTNLNDILVVTTDDSTKPVLSVKDSLSTLRVGLGSLGGGVYDAGLFIRGTNFPNNAIKLEGVNNSGGFITYLTKPGTALPVSNERLGFIYMGSIYNATTPLHAAGMKATADANWTTSSTPASFSIETTASGSTARVERVRFSSNGNVGIGTTVPTSKLQVVGLPQYANNAAALAGGLTVGAFYRTGGDPDLVAVVH